MTRLLPRASLRFYLRHPWQLALAIVGISLGVGVYVGVTLANDSASRSFDAASERLRGSLTHRLLPIDGDLDELVFPELSQRYGIAAASPVVEGIVEIAAHPGRPVPLVGFDPRAQLRLRVTDWLTWRGGVGFYQQPPGFPVPPWFPAGRP